MVQSRGVASSLAYQPIQAKSKEEELSIEQICMFKGNALALQHAPDLLIIADVDVNVAQERLKLRRKDDSSAMEKLEIQLKMAEAYRSQWFREFLESKGLQVAYLDCGGSIEQTRQQAISLALPYLGHKP